MKDRYLKIVHLIKESFRNPGTRVASFVIFFAIIGTVTLLLIHAAQPNTNVQPETGQKSGTVTCNNTANTSKNDCVQFGAGNSISAPPTTALTIVGTDGVTGNALCLDNSATVSSSSVTACIQVNPSNTSQARGGTYDTVQMKFVATTGWTNLPDITTAGQVSTKTCSGSNHTFFALGPLGTTYYGEEINNSSASFGTLDGTGTCSSSAGGVISSTQWATPAIYCSASANANPVTTLSQLISAVNADQSEICVAPGNYTFTASMSSIGPKASMKIIGQSPLQRPVFDSSALPKHNAQGQALSTGTFVAGGAKATIANLVVEGAQTDDGGVKNNTCAKCGLGIDGGDGIHIYNVKMSGNQENGFHWHHPGSTLHYILENSELSNNGNDGDRQWSAAGFKTTGSGLIKHNVVTNNDGNGLWCDGNNQATAVCHDGVWQVLNNYVAGNWGPGIHFEIDFKENPGAVIDNNVVNCNNVTGKNFLGGITIFGAYVTVSGNIFDNRNGADIAQALRCTDGAKQAVYVYNDTSRVPPYTHDITVTNNSYLSGDVVNCTAAQKQLATLNLNPTIICLPNTSF